MKPSERRALEAEKRAQKEAAMREKELEAKAQYSEMINENNTESGKRAEGESLNADAQYRQVPKGDIKVEGDGYHREGFFGSHVRLITFIIAFALVATVLGPWGIDMLVSKSREAWNGNESEDGAKLTVNHVIALSDMGYDMTWGSLKGFGYEDSSYTKKGKTTYNYKYSFEESDSLCLEVIGSSNTGSPDIVRLIDYSSGEYIEIRKESASAFLKKHGYIE